MPPALGDLGFAMDRRRNPRNPGGLRHPCQMYFKLTEDEKGSENLETNDNTTHLFFDCPGAGVHRVN
jgi:hypothetical protein